VGFMARTGNGRIYGQTTERLEDRNQGVSNANVHAATFSMVREAILAESARLKRPVTYDDIGIALASSSHKHASTLQALYQRSPQKDTFLRWSASFYSVLSLVVLTRPRVTKHRCVRETICPIYI
jgi:hypothetical protein